MALSTISGTTGITDATITSAKLADFTAAVDLNGVELLLDADADTSISADTDDRIDFKIANTDHFSLSSSSGDTVFKPLTDAKDLIFQQFDGNKVLEINDSGFVGIGGNSNAAGEIRIFEDTDDGNNYVGLKVGNVTTAYTLVFPNADGSNGQAMVTNGSGVLSFTDVTANVALDDVQTGDAAVTLATSSGNITIDAQGNDTDIIFKGTDGSADTTFLTLDGSAAGAASFNGAITANAGVVIDNITIDGDRITNSTNGIDINAAGAVNLITQQKITNVTTAVSARAVSENPLLTEDADSTVATKGYVDTELGSKTLVFGLDVTGLTITVSSSASDNNDVKAILTSLANPVTIPNGTLAFIHASSTAVTGTDTADVNSQLNKSFLAVDSGGTQNVSVIQDVSVGAVPISTTFNITRYTMKFKVIAGVWSHEVTTTYTP